MLNSVYILTPRFSGADQLLMSLNAKQSAGGELSGFDKVMSSSAYAAKISETYGPSPRDAQPNPVPLPEVVQGVIASARV